MSITFWISSSSLRSRFLFTPDTYSVTDDTILVAEKPTPIFYKDSLSLKNRWIIFCRYIYHWVNKHYSKNNLILLIATSEKFITEYVIIFITVEFKIASNLSKLHLNIVNTYRNTYSKLHLYIASVIFFNERLIQSDLFCISVKTLRPIVKIHFHLCSQNTN